MCCLGFLCEGSGTAQVWVHILFLLASDPVVIVGSWPLWGKEVIGVPFKCLVTELQHIPSSM